MWIPRKTDTFTGTQACAWRQEIPIPMYANSEVDTEACTYALETYRFINMQAATRIYIYMWRPLNLYLYKHAHRSVQVCWPELIDVEAWNSSMYTHRHILAYTLCIYSYMQTEMAYITEACTNKPWDKELCMYHRLQFPPVLSPHVNSNILSTHRCTHSETLCKQ